MGERSLAGHRQFWGGKGTGELERLTKGEGRSHVHNGGFLSDGERIVFTRDEDDAHIFLLVPEG